MVGIPNYFIISSQIFTVSMDYPAKRVRLAQRFMLSNTRHTTVTSFLSNFCLFDKREKVAVGETVIDVNPWRHASRHTRRYLYGTPTTLLP